MKAIAKYKIQWINSINQLSVELNALMMSENLNSLMTLFMWDDEISLRETA